MEHFIGSDLDRAEMDLRGIRIAPEHREGEARLMTTRWFDYRDMHPVAATYLFAHFYVEQTRKFYIQNVDIRTVEDARAFTPDDIFMSRDLTSMWLARRAADELGLPYPFVLQFAQSRFLSRLQHRFPRPNQLYGEEFEIDVAAAWQERLGCQLTYSTQARYKASAWARQLAQAQHIKFVVQQVKRRPGPHHRILARLFNEDVLAAHLIKNQFSQKELLDAERYRAELK